MKKLYAIMSFLVFGGLLFSTQASAASISAVEAEGVSVGSEQGRGGVCLGTSEDAIVDLDCQEVTIAVENAYLPFNYIDEVTGEAGGWDYDAWDEICPRLHCTPVYVEAAWEGMIQAVGDGQYDAAADGITINAERDEIVDFSIGYVAIEQRLLVRSDETRIESIDDIVNSGSTGPTAGRTLEQMIVPVVLALAAGLVVFFGSNSVSKDSRGLVRWGGIALILVALVAFFAWPQQAAGEELVLGTQTGTTNYETALNYLPAERIQAFEQFPFAVQALIAGDIDAVIIDETAGQGYLGANAEDLKLVGPSLSSDQLGFIFPPGSDLVDPVNQALQAMMDDGTLNELNAIYFGADFNCDYTDTGITCGS